MAVIPFKAVVKAINSTEPLYSVWCHRNGQHSGRVTVWSEGGLTESELVAFLVDRPYWQAENLEVLDFPLMTVSDYQLEYS